MWSESESDADLLERLFAQFEDRHTFAVIEKITARSRADLTGQTLPGAHDELLERLIRQRLTDLPATRPVDQTIVRATSAAELGADLD